MLELSDIIKQKIKDNGPVCFREFMEICLYYPELGYYTSQGAKIGPEGDFYTSPNLTPVFGALIGKQLEEMWENLERQPFTIVEYGAGTGMLCHDILSYLKNNVRMYEQLRYCIIEKSPVMKDIEKKHLSQRVTWHDSIEELGAVTGCVLSNELLDTFAVHQVIIGKQLMEVFVDYDNGFREVLLPACDDVKAYLNELGTELAEGFRTEINLQAIHWIRNISAVLKQGYVLTIDYGFLSDELYKPSRSHGTLVAFKDHQINYCPYQHIGKQDITSHVNFSALIHWGNMFELDVCGLTDQCHFLLSMGFKETIQQAYEQENDIFKAAKKIAAISNALLVDMGSKFKVLIQQKGINSVKLKGLESCLPLTTNKNNWLI